MVALHAIRPFVRFGPRPDRRLNAPRLLRRAAPRRVFGDT
jgi:hypothetical protein